MFQPYVDLDGVLADFDKGYEEAFGAISCKAIDNVNWQLVKDKANFYRDLPPMPDFDELWKALEHLNPIILTGVPNLLAEEATANKRAWVDKHLGTHVHMIGCKSKDKCLHGNPGDVLIDDWEKYMHHWIDMGGHWITHTSAKDSISKFKDYLAEFEGK